MDKPESCVETPAAPEWLSKLESRREKLTRAKLGHESGAGAPCNECGDKCPGLDLHFWRKVCRNCKCRKDQHKCPDDDLSGWAQFEILGQIRSKPAYMKIKALADQPVQLEWVPPNVALDVVSDYMDKLGSDQIPVAGSDAAAKRKQQLEFQMPLHDLDASLCDNLTESEAAQLQQYVQKIRENCVGQGNVVRVGNVQHGSVVNVTPLQSSVISKLGETPTHIVNDKILSNLLTSEALCSALLTDKSYPYPKALVAFTQPLPKLDSKSIGNSPLNMATVQSLISNGPIYDKILSNLKSKNIDISSDPMLKPISDFRQEYIRDNPSESFQYATPIKSSHTDAFNSPLPLRNPIPARFASSIKQDTPMRKVKFGSVNIFHEIGLPEDMHIEKDPVFAKILNSEPLQNALQTTAVPLGGNKKVIVSHLPLSADFESVLALSPDSKDKLTQMGLNQDAVQSAVVNGPFYDKLFHALRLKSVNYAECKLLAPLEHFREEFLANHNFQRETLPFVETIPNSFDIAYSEDRPTFLPGYHFNKPSSLFNSQTPLKGGLHGSRSTDSGFDSKPSTPNYATHPGLVNQDDELLGFNANSGRFTSIPGIEDLNMYPHVEPSDHVSKPFQNMQIASSSPSDVDKIPVPILKCKECSKDIMSGEVAVKAERAGKEIAWHPQCFKCHECHELLADLVYFFHSGNVYCGRDLAIILKIPRCNACDELIFTKEYTAAESSTFHIKHFCCYQCDIPLAGQQYIPDEKTNMPLCLKCYDEFYAERCQKCSNVIGPTEQGVAWGQIHWHGECFLCAGVGCGKSLIGGRFCVKNDMPFCSSTCVKSVVI